MFRRLAQALLILLAFAIPIEHKYDKPLRHLSSILLPKGLILHHFDKKISFYASDVAAILLFVLALFAFKIPLRRLMLDKGAPLLWILFACAAISLCFSPLHNYPVVYTRLLQLLTPILLFAVLSHTPTPGKTTSAIFAALIAAAAMQSLVALIQYKTQSPLGLSLLNESRHQGASFAIMGGYRWIFDELLHRKASTIFVIRSYGTLAHPNVLGSFLALSLVASYSFIAATEKIWLRRLLGLALALQFLALTVTYSRSAIFGWILGTLIWFGFTLYRRGLKTVAFDRRIRFLASTILVSVVLSSALFHKQYLKRGGVFNYNEFAASSDQIRLDAQTIAIRLIAEQPLIGVGYQQYTQAATRQLPSGQSADLVHNIYLLIAAEMGLIALIAFLAFSAWIGLAAIRSPYTPQISSLLGMFFALLFVGGCDFTPIALQPGRLLLFSVAGLLAAEGLSSVKHQQTVL